MEKNVKNLKDMNMKELFEEFKKSMNKVHKANVDIGLILAELSPEEAIISISQVLGAAIEAYIEVIGDVEVGFDKTSKVLAPSFIALKKEYDKDYVSVLTKNYYEDERIEQMVNNLRNGIIGDDNDEDDEEEGDDLVC